LKGGKTKKKRNTGFSFWGRRSRREKKHNAVKNGKKKKKKKSQRMQEQEKEDLRTQPGKAPLWTRKSVRL